MLSLFRYFCALVTSTPMERLKVPNSLMVIACPSASQSFISSPKRDIYLQQPNANIIRNRHSTYILQCSHICFFQPLLYVDDCEIVLLSFFFVQAHKIIEMCSDRLLLSFYDI